MTAARTKPIDREIFHVLCKVQILLHAAKKPVARERLLDDFRGQNPRIDGRTLPLLLNRLVRIGWLERARSLTTTRSTEPYRLTREGRIALQQARNRLLRLEAEMFSRPARTKRLHQTTRQSRHEI